jgi:hypothetical protein
MPQYMRHYLRTELGTASARIKCRANAAETFPVAIDENEVLGLVRCRAFMVGQQCFSEYPIHWDGSGFPILSVGAFDVKQVGVEVYGLPSKRESLAPNSQAAMDTANPNSPVRLAGGVEEPLFLTIV